MKKNFWMIQNLKIHLLMKICYMNRMNNLNHYSELFVMEQNMTDYLKEKLLFSENCYQSYCFLRCPDSDKNPDLNKILPGLNYFCSGYCY
jgi:hypothetical protein